MRNTTLILLFAFVCLTDLSAQNFSSSNPDYINFVKAGERCLKAEKYDSCITYYDQAFAIKQTSFLSTMRYAACGYSSGDMDIYKSQLDFAFELDRDGSKQIYENYEEFRYLDGTAFQEEVLERWSSLAEASGLDLKLMEEFKAIRFKDQEQRMLMGPMSEKYGWDSPKMDSLWAIQSYWDSINTQRITELIDSIGYPGKSLIGSSLASTAFLVIQHADLETQEKYLEIIKQDADEEEVRWSSVALLIDRVEMRNDRPQIYGSQVGSDPDTNENYFFEIENPEQIDSIRATVGLPPLQEYGDRWNIKWDPSKHRKKVAEMKAKEKDK